MYRIRRFFRKLKKRSRGSDVRVSRRRKPPLTIRVRSFIGGIRRRKVHGGKRIVWKDKRVVAAVCGIIAVAAVTSVVLATSAGQSDEQKQEQVSAAVLSETTPSTPAETVQEPILLKEGTDDEMVATLQQRLMDLGYMDQDEPTVHFGKYTLQAVKRFQMKNGFDETGEIDNSQWVFLNSDAVAEFSMVVGMEGEDVAGLQERLRDLGYLDAGATGYFGTDTLDAVKKFQEKNGLSADGTAGGDTLEKLYSDDVVANALGRGEEGEKVLELQNVLRQLGYLTTEPDGKYGNDTVNAVKRLQTRNGLIADGYYGYDTRQLVLSGDVQTNALIIGMSGSDVTKVQDRLVKLGYMKSSTGYYGEGTAYNVSRFQRRNGLSADGKVGRATLNALLADSAKKCDGKPTNSAPEGSGSGGSSGGGGSSSGGGGGGSTISNLIAKAKTKMGCPYVLGAKGPSRFDCSGFVYWCFKSIGANQGYKTATTWRNSGGYKTIKSMGDLKVGDVICFTPRHVGIVIGGGKMIHSAPSQGGVGISSYYSPYWKKHFVNGKRVL